MGKKSSRRDFLFGRSALRSIREKAGERLDEADHGLDASITPESTGDPEQATYLLTISRDAMGGTFEISLNAGQYDDGTNIALETLDIANTLEDELSYFREDSEVSRLNREAFDEPVFVSDNVFHLLQFADRMTRETDGAFDITSAILWKAWGFARREGAIPTEAELAQAMETVGMRHVELDAELQAVRLLKNGVEINFGGIGKGFALDRCAEQMQAAGIDDFFMHGGQSSIIAHGSRRGGKTLDGRPIKRGWSIGISHPMRSGKRLGEIILLDQAVATSGSGMQFFRHQGRRYSHILDPRTGRPAEGMYSVTVVAPDALTADALSTAFFVMGEEATLAYCDRHPEIGVVLVTQTRHAPGFKATAQGLSDDQLLWHEAW